jgi:DNA-directed RNA polymerase subunit RPC12/RpoP
MAVRFLCTHCQKPLEVDDRDAGKEVVCFYCHQQVRVPRESEPALGLAPGALPPASKVWGAVGLAASLAMIAGFLIIFFWGVSQLLPLSRTPEYMAAKPALQKKMADARAREVLKHPMITTGRWVILGLALVGVFFSIVGIVRKSGRGAAVAGLIIGGGFIAIQIVMLVKNLAAPR